MSSNTDLGEQFVFDACALIAYFNDEVGAEIVEDVWTQSPRPRPVICRGGQRVRVVLRLP